MSVLTGVPLYFPRARHWMWDYCVYLGPWTHKSKNYDMGIYINPETQNVSLAVVYGNEPGEYMSGRLDPDCNEIHFETVYRAVALNLITAEGGKICPILE